MSNETDKSFGNQGQQPERRLHIDLLGLSIREFLGRIRNTQAEAPKGAESNSNHNVIAVDSSMVTDPTDPVDSQINWSLSFEWCQVQGDVDINSTSARMRYVEEKQREMEDGGCIESRGCDEVNIQHIPSTGPGSRSYGSIGRGRPYLDQGSYEDVTGQPIEEFNSVDLDDKKS
jgi:hypothetical protein